jgi:hypothetical protein
MSTNTGGPAFPVQSVYIEDQETNSHGMTLRDYFAAKAMQGELAAQSEESGHYTNLDALAVLAYRVADAMLKERAK